LSLVDRLGIVYYLIDFLHVVLLVIGVFGADIQSSL
jgi:hypothetical protein